MRKCSDPAKCCKCILKKLRNLPSTFVPRNTTALVGPSPSDDSTQGYGVGSTWVDSFLGYSYDCISAAVGAAVWKVRPRTFTFTTIGVTNWQPPALGTWTGVDVEVVAGAGGSGGGRQGPSGANRLGGGAGGGGGRAGPFFVSADAIGVGPVPVTTPPPALTGEEGASRFNGEPTTLPSPKAVPQPWTFREELEGSSCRTTAIKAGGPEPPEGGDASWTNVGSFTSETSSDNPIKPVFRERPSDVVQPSVEPRVALTWEMARRTWWMGDISCPRGGGPPPATSEAGACSPSVTVGDGGLGGLGANAPNTNGADGVAGDNSSFGAFVRAVGGARGTGGTSAFAAGGSGGTGEQSGSPGGSGSTSTGTAGSNSPGGGAGGGGGGGLGAGNNSAAGGPGGNRWSVWGAQPGGLGGVAPGGNGSPGSPSPVGMAQGAPGGGGGASNHTGPGGNGADGVDYGAAGGGGGASTNGNKAGDGAKGAQGIVLIKVW
jgi:hypothetical protein